jgi:hypothetical protein
MASALTHVYVFNVLEPEMNPVSTLLNDFVKRREWGFCNYEDSHNPDVYLEYMNGQDGSGDSVWVPKGMFIHLGVDEAVHQNGRFEGSKEAARRYIKKTGLRLIEYKDISPEELLDWNSHVLGELSYCYGIKHVVPRIPYDINDWKRKTDLDELAGVLAGIFQTEKEAAKEVLDERFMRDVHDCMTLHPIFFKHEVGLQEMLNYVGLGSEREISRFMNDIVADTGSCLEDMRAEYRNKNGVPGNL